VIAEAIRVEICRRLANAEDEYGVRILFAVESSKRGRRESFRRHQKARSLSGLCLCGVVVIGWLVPARRTWVKRRCFEAASGVKFQR